MNNKRLNAMGPNDVHRIAETKLYPSEHPIGKILPKLVLKNFTPLINEEKEIGNPIAKTLAEDEIT
jgi:hypothetical protein